MKKFVAVFCLLLSAATLQAKDKPNPANFPIKIHVSASQMDFAYPMHVLLADTVLNGKKVKLGIMIPDVHKFGSNLMVLKPGDYQIRLLKDESEADGAMVRLEYEFLLPNGETVKSAIVGISE
jgi:hypothetical protein